ncbi:MAG: transglutaminase domain-containing protein [Thermoleophilia bacterium]|nr:transglutaminase domain-containing protein [Thermoleophilia bacterium]
MRRTALLYLLPALLVPTAWLRLETGPNDRRAVWLVLLALVPALVRPWWARVPATLAAAGVAAAVALRVSPLDARPFSEREFFGPAWERLRQGVLNFWEVAQPFSPAEHAEMHGAVLLAIFAFCAVIAHAIAARRPLLAGVALLAGSLWPATIVAGSDLTRGAVTLGAVLLLLATARDRPARNLRPVAVAAVALVAAAVAASTSPAVSKPELLAWRTWDVYDAPEDPVSVRYVWDANYGGVEFPKEKTVVLEVEAPANSRYWRATTLDVFTDDRWIEELEFRGTGEGRVRLLREPFLPRKVANRSRWVRADVRVKALDDEHLVGGTMPVMFDTGDAGRVGYFGGNVAVADETPGRDEEYSVWSYAPEPTPRQLAAARPRPNAVPGLRRYLEVAPRLAAPLFGERGRDAAVERLFADEQVAPYRPLYRKAVEVAGGVRTPYAAAVALEAWLRTQGGFVYEERPGLGFDRPPLVDFVTRSKAGYCQQFAGAMALMLRYLGVPARVGAGFTTGQYDKDKGRWEVADTDAHTWVEVWFPGYGWLPFDPTPTRGTLSGAYTTASEGFNAPQAAAVLAGAAFEGRSGSAFAQELARRYAAQNEGFAGRDAPGDYAPLLVQRRPGESLLRFLALVVLAGACALAVGKLVLRRSRYVTRDPRRLAAACRRELVEFLADQGLAVPRSATLAEAGALLEHRLAVDAGPFVRAATRARFSPPDEARAAAREARHELRRLERQIRRRVGLRGSLRGAVSLRSLAA